MSEGDAFMYKKGKSRIVAVIPAYNEENTIENTINALKKSVWLMIL